MEKIIVLVMWPLMRVGCECPIGLNYTSQCKWIYTLSQIKECSDFYFKSWDGTCKSYDRMFLNGKELNPSVKNYSQSRTILLTTTKYLYKSKERNNHKNAFLSVKVFYKPSLFMTYQTFVPTS